MTWLEALVALGEEGTMTRAATRLRVTPSAISKRVAALEQSVGRKLVLPDGRRVRLTDDARRLVDAAVPALASLRDALEGEPAGRGGVLGVAVSESILASWGPGVLALAARQVPGLRLELHAHRSPVALDRVQAGEVPLALVAGRVRRATGLRGEVLLEEEMVVIPRDGDPASLRGEDTLRVWTIERNSGTWRALRPRLRRLRTAGGPQIEVDRVLQSFSGLVQVGCAGFAHTLVPLGVARALGVSDEEMLHFDEPGLARPVTLAGRKTGFHRPLVAAFRKALREALAPLPEPDAP